MCTQRTQDLTGERGGDGVKSRSIKGQLKFLVVLVTEESLGHLQRSDYICRGKTQRGYGIHTDTSVKRH